MKIAVVKYNAGNIKSVKNALDRLGAEAIVSDDPEVLRSADKVIFPGVGEACCRPFEQDDCARKVRSR